MKHKLVHMKKMTTWMVMVALAAMPLTAQEAEPSENEEEQQIEEAINEAIGETEESMDETTEMMEQEAEPRPGPLQEEYEAPRHHERGEYREVKTLMKGSGGFGALSIGYTGINTMVNDQPTIQPALLMGARAEWVLGHGLGIGFGAVGFATDNVVPDGSDYRYGMAGGYGGLVMEPIVVGWFPIHVSFPLLIGGGGITSYGSYYEYPFGNEPEFSNYAAFFVAEAGAALELNLVRGIVLSLFANYRWTPELSPLGLEGSLDESGEYSMANDALTGWSAGIRFKFGSF